MCADSTTNGPSDRERPGKPDIERTGKPDTERPGKPDIERGAQSLGRPTLVVQTVYFHDSDRDEARRLGKDLYRLLSRPTDEPLAFGAGVPVLWAVAPDSVDTEAARHVVVIPVLGHETFLLAKAKVVAQINKWHDKLGPGHVLPVPLSANWRGAENKLPGVLLLSRLYAEGDRERRTADEIILGIADVLGGSRPTLFISHAKPDLRDTKGVATKIRDFVATTTGGTFYDSVDLSPGHALATALDSAIDKNKTVFLAVRGDAYSQRPWCQLELLLAKKRQVPALVVEVLNEGEPRSSSFGGNLPTMVWRTDDDTQEVASRAMVQWIKVRLFEQEARRVARAADLPPPEIMPRAPELLDFAHVDRGRDRPEFVMYPDPELAVAERRLLAGVHRRLHMMTPTTAFRYLQPRTGDKRQPEETVSAADRLGAQAPLDGWRIALSLSRSPDAGGPDGYTEYHVKDAITYVARTLISAGGSIAYGGDARIDGYTELLSQLIVAYNQTAREEAELLHNYQPADFDLGKVPMDWNITSQHLAKTDRLNGRPRLSAPAAGEGISTALYLSDMRRVMAEDVAASVLVGGKTKPTVAADDGGYTGRFPGVVEEAWRVLEENKPVYVVGGYGGAAGIVADLLAGKQPSDDMCDDAWRNEADYQRTVEEYNRFAAQLRLPASLDDLAERIREHGQRLLANHDASTAWNGLDVDENALLFRTRDPVTIASLVLKGLLAVTRESAVGKLQIELVHGDVRNASDVDVLSVPVSGTIPIGGAAGAVDDVLQNRVSRAQDGARSIISVDSDALRVDWVHVARLDPAPDDLERVYDVRRAAADAAWCATRYGFRSLGVVLYGGTMSETVDPLVDDMVTTFAEELRPGTRLVWYETDRTRFEAIRGRLESKDQVRLTTRLDDVPPAVSTGASRALLHVELSDDGSQLATTFVAPAGTAIARKCRVTVGPGKIAELSAGVGESGESTPGLEDLVARGKKLAELLLGDDADEVLKKIGDSEILISHNLMASKIPFETLATDSVPTPAATLGITRRLIVEGVRAPELFARRVRGNRLRALLIVDPMNDLPGAKKEGKEVAAILGQPHVDLKILVGDEATRANVIDALQKADLLHFCGHAFFDGPGLDESGISLAQADLTLRDLKGLRALPRVTFFNACEAGRVRGRRPEDSPPELPSKAAAFAEFFLRGGVEAYLGTHWRVGDIAAGVFAPSLYQRLLAGESFDEAVRQARLELLNVGHKDWANYILYGEGSFRLVLA